jgi:ankyrin repeat protein
VNVQENNGHSALSIACVDGNTELVKALLAMPQINTDTWTTKGDSILIAACGSGHLDIVQLLLADSRINANAKNDHGSSAISLAAKFGYSETIKNLLPHVDDVNFRDDDGDTALMCAVIGASNSLSSALMIRSPPRLKDV